MRAPILPDQLLLGHEGPEIPRDRSHVPVRQLVPGLRESIREFFRIRVEAPRYLLVGRIHPQCEVRGGHHRGVAPRCVVCIRHGARSCATLRGPLVRTAGTFCQFPLVLEEDVEVVVVPSDRVGRPCALDPAADRIVALAGAETILPAEALRLDAGALGFGTDILARFGGAVALAEGVPAGDKRHGFFVIHRHAGEGLANIARRSYRVRIAVRPLRVDVDQAHLDGAQGVRKFTVTGVAFVAKPIRFGSPVDVLSGLPDVLAATGEAEGLEPH